MPGTKVSLVEEIPLFWTLGPTIPNGEWGLSDAELLPAIDVATSISCCSDHDPHLLPRVALPCSGTVGLREYQAARRGGLVSAKTWQHVALGLKPGVGLTTTLGNPIGQEQQRPHPLPAHTVIQGCPQYPGSHRDHHSLLFPAWLPHCPVC